jgi:hypothetical protein
VAFLKFKSPFLAICDSTHHGEMQSMASMHTMINGILQFGLVNHPENAVHRIQNVFAGECLHWSKSFFDLSEEAKISNCEFQ